MSEPAAAVGNCPFLGRRAAMAPFAHGVLPGQHLLFLASESRQCALVNWTFHPCDLYMVGKLPDWRDCPLWKDAARPTPEGA